MATDIKNCLLTGRRIMSMIINYNISSNYKETGYIISSLEASSNYTSEYYVVLAVIL